MDWLAAVLAGTNPDPAALNAELGRVEPFSPGALIRRAKRRRPIGEVAAVFGIDSQSLRACIRNLRRDDPDYPVRRRKLRGTVYVEPVSAVPVSAEPPRRRPNDAEECRRCGRWAPRAEFVRQPFGRWNDCADCRATKKPPAA
jgi:hypothetical protein